MDEEQLKRQIGARLISYRKRDGLTQAGLAQKLNYSDKAVSKWERGESLPDVVTLVQLAQVFGVTVNDLVSAGAEAPKKAAPPKRKADRRIIQMLTSLLVWFVALLVFVVLSTLSVSRSWISFFYAVPVNAIVLLSLRSAWRQFDWNQILISVIVWGTLLSLFMTLLVFAGFNAWRIFLLGIPGQAAICLWFRMFRPAAKEEENG